MTEEQRVRELLAKQHEAMGDVMMLRRLSANPRQREMAEAAIAVYLEVEAFLTVTPPCDCGKCLECDARIYHDDLIAELPPRLRALAEWYEAKTWPVDFTEGRRRIARDLHDAAELIRDLAARAILSPPADEKEKG